MNIHEYLKNSPRGTKARLASVLNVPPSLITQWLGDRGIPAGREIEIAQATGWAVTPHEINPRLYPNPTDALPTVCAPVVSENHTPATTPVALEQQ